MEPAKFRAYLEAEIGKRAAELVTVAPPGEAGRPSKEEMSDTVSDISSADERKAGRLRAILRAPEAIQNLYREGLVSQAVAAGDRSRRPNALGRQHFGPAAGAAAASAGLAGAIRSRGGAEVGAGEGVTCAGVAPLLRSWKRCPWGGF